MLKLTLSLAFNFQRDALHDFVPFTQFKKREKRPQRSIASTNVSPVALLKVTFLLGVSHVFLNEKTVPNHAKHLIYFKDECSFKEKMMMNK